MLRLHIALIFCSLAALPVECRAQAVIGEMFASDASVRGSVLFASGGTQIQSGSSVTAGDAAAVLKLRRGGEVRVCPKTNVSVSASPNGRDLLWGMNTGSIEAHFTLSASADTVMTPDFRILLSGPGIFHFAISADAHGNMCVKALAQNTASLIVSELNGDGTYQVKPNVQVLFKNGTVSEPSALVPAECGCPAPPVPIIETAQQKPPEPQPAPTTPTVIAAAPALPSVPDNSTLAPRPVPSDIAHLQMEAPFVYEAGNPEKELDTVAARLRLTSGSELPKATVLPPPTPVAEPPKSAAATAAVPAKPKEKKGLFGKIGSFFSHIFK